MTNRSQTVTQQDPETIARRLAEGELREAIGLEREDVSVLKQVADRAFAAGDRETAMRTYVTLVLLDPTSTEIQLALAECALSLGFADLALQAASTAIATSPAEPRAYLASARACIAMGLTDEAREDLADVQRFAREARNGELFAEAQELLEQLP